MDKWRVQSLSSNEKLRRPSRSMRSRPSVREARMTAWDAAWHEADKCHAPLFTVGEVRKWWQGLVGRDKLRRVVRAPAF